MRRPKGDVDAAGRRAPARGPPIVACGCRPLAAGRLDAAGVRHRSAWALNLAHADPARQGVITLISLVIPTTPYRHATSSNAASLSNW